MKTLTSYIPIELTEEQELRMIAMCETLFPNREWKLKGCMITHEEVVLKKEDKEYIELEVPWLEFLIYKLVPTFSKKNGPITMTWSMQTLQNDSNNMIDKFYEKHFKPYYDENQS